ncbi:PREDICTED: uncharacterized protein LOC106804703 [Priapulus caudatus]|uniref:Uncharacterized protein LOC106804703 n=1 Tax=Priapulus caudatus TaxID=37621 RepID=A0ABM1DNF8_PRICU|nr:PREDICTED: uncharacterized protein LOC106804703 [Priapulus caudatus]
MENKQSADNGAENLNILTSRDAGDVIIEAALSGNTDTIKQALVCGANLEQESQRGATALLLAAWCGHVDVIKELLEARCGVEESNEDGMTALMLAAQRGHTDGVSLLVEAGANVEHCNDDGETALMFAAQCGHTDVVSLLVEAGANVEHCNGEGVTALMLAAWCGYDGVLEVLLHERANVERRDNHGDTALLCAAWDGQREAVERLLAADAMLEPSNNQGRTALLAAAMAGHADIVGILLKAGADLEHEDRDCMTSLLLAAWCGHAAIVEILLNAGANSTHRNQDGMTALRLAVRFGHADVIEALVAAGDNVEDVDQNGMTALMSAAWCGRLDVVATLLKAGARVQHTDKRGDTALFLAAWNGQRRVVGALLDAGADVMHINNDNDTAMMLAAFDGHPEVITTLLEKGTPLEHVNLWGRTALLAAAMGGHADTIRLLLDSGANMEHVDLLLHETALLLASWRGHKDCVETLLKAGANLEHINKKGMTAVHLAARCGHTKVIRVLLAAHPNLERRHLDEDTALVLSVRFGHIDVVTMLLDAGAGRQSADVTKSYDTAVGCALKVPLNDNYKQIAGLLLRYELCRLLPESSYCDVPHVNTHTATDVSNVKSFTDLLDCPGLGRIQHPVEGEAVRLAVEQLIKEVSDEMVIIDPVFSCSPRLVGSAANGTKAGLPDEFDFVFEMNKFENRVEIRKTSMPGVVTVYNAIERDYVFVQIKERFMKVFVRGVSNVLRRGFSLLRISNNSSLFHWNKVCTQLNLTYVGEGHYSYLPLSVDVTPVIRVLGTPADANDYPPTTQYYHVVPKPRRDLISCDISSHRYWSVCTALAESALIRGYSAIFRDAVIVAKALLNPHVHDYEGKIRGIANAEDLLKHPNVTDLRECNIEVTRLFIATRCKANSMIDSYLLKLAVIHVHSSMSREPPPSRVDVIVLELFKYIHKCFGTEGNDGEIEHPLIHGLNMLAEDKYKVVDYVPAVYLRRKYIAALLARLASGKLVSNSGLLHLSATDLWPRMKESVRRAQPDGVADIEHWFAEAWLTLCKQCE